LRYPRQSGKRGDTLVLSDGIIFEYSLVSPSPRVTRCKQCGGIFTLDKKSFSGEAGWSMDYVNGAANRPIRDEWKNAMDAEFLTIDECIAALTGTRYNREDEIYIRTRIYIACHQKTLDTLIEEKRAQGEAEIEKHKRRGLGFLLEKINLTVIRYTMDEADRALYDQNIRALIPLLDEHTAKETVVIAELYRNIGEFGECLKLLDTVKDEKYHGLTRQIKDECARENTCVFIVKR
jgi:hypothetical protein